MATGIGVPAALCGTALLSSGAASTIARLTVITGLQSVLFVALGASQGLMPLGVAVITSTAISTILWFRATSREIGLSIRHLVIPLRQSGAVALLAGIGPALVSWGYGLYPEAIVGPLVLGGAGGMVGFAVGVMVLGHPLRDEFISIWSKIGP